MSDALEQGKAYVEKMLAAGKTDEEVRAALTQAGWQAAAMEQVLGPPPETDPRDICTAAREGAAGRVRYLLMKGEDPNLRGPAGSPLICAAQGKKAGVVEVLLKWGVNVHQPGPDGRTALHVAAEQDDTVVMGKLLATGVDPDLRDMSRGTALHTAARENLAAMAKYLLENGAEPNADDDGGRTAVHKAAAEGNLEVLGVLLDGGGEADKPDSAGRTPLHAAAKAGQAEACRRLLSRGVQINQQDSSGKTALAVATGEAVELLKSLGGR